MFSEILGVAAESVVADKAAQKAESKWKLKHTVAVVASGIAVSGAVKGIKHLAGLKQFSKSK